MKVFVAGASGAMGSRLVPLLVAGGYEVVAMTRSPQKVSVLRAAGAEAVVADAFDRAAVIEAVTRARPEVVIHQLTGLTGVTDVKDFDREFALTNRLRTEGTDHLMEAARAAGARRFIAQSYGSWIYERSGGGLKTENDPLDPAPPANQAASLAASLAAIRHLEGKVTGTPDIAGLALRYGSFYGPGTSIAADGDIAAMVRKRRLPALARATGAKPPRHVPVWLGRAAAGEVGVSMMTRIRGNSNAKAKAKRELGWFPRYPSYREGFRDGLGGGPSQRLHSSGGAVDSRRAGVEKG